MFVEIDNKDKSAIYIDGEIKKARGAGEITPDFAMYILSQTNHRSNIKTLVKAIKDSCLNTEQIKPYREFILSCVDEREVSGDTLACLQEMAKMCGCEAEFVDANNKPKFFKDTDCIIEIIESLKDVKCITGKNNAKTGYFDANFVTLTDYDFDHLDEVRFKKGSKIDLLRIRNLPKKFDVSGCSEVILNRCNLDKVKKIDFSNADFVYLSNCGEINVENVKFKAGSNVHLSEMKKFSKGLDLSVCDYVKLDFCDLAYVEKLDFKEGAKVELFYIKNMPSEIDVSMCDEVEFSYLDLANVKDIKFKDGAKVWLSNVSSLPEDLDLSMCDDVTLIGCDLGNIKDIKFKDGAKVRLDDVKGVPEDLDFSKCSALSLGNCDLKGLKELKFKKGAKVFFNDTKLPEVLDLSMCSFVSFSGHNFDGVKEVRFKNKWQRKKFFSDIDEQQFSGEVVYTGELKTKILEIFGKGMG